ncbi:unnamed protein product [Orchesella dallaii]|uniref:Prostaglandin reductase 1 n=1 Tax=Orchesella dallaii TaxID=48710 RepID=A0ABP1QQN1_9HEXA
MKTRKIVLSNRFNGLPKPEDFAIKEEELPDVLKDGEILCQAEWISVDPYMRMRASTLNLGDAMIGMQVARVLKSRCPEYPEGSQVVANFGWVERTIFKPERDHGVETIYKMPEMKGLPDSYALGTVGRPGNTAYFGCLRVCKPKEKDTIVVSAAAGAVGSLVGQIAKIQGCTVLGFAGSDNKVKWLQEKLKFDHAFNYKTANLPDVLAQYASNGVDAYFDNVGGEFTYHVMKHMKPFGRVALCGAISTYNSTDSSKPALVPFDYGSMIYKNITMEGLHVLRWRDEWYTGINQLRDWILEGKIIVEETITEGFQNTPEAFINMLKGENVGKAVVKV